MKKRKNSLHPKNPSFMCAGASNIGKPDNNKKRKKKNETTKTNQKKKRNKKKD